MSIQLDAPATLHPEKEPLGIHSINSWMGTRIGLDTSRKREFLTLPGLELNT
jgi:hypothetical protein